MLPAGSNFSVASFMTYGGMFCGIPVGIIRFLAGNIGTTIILTGLFVIDILLLTHWSVSNGAKKVGEQTEKGLVMLKREYVKSRKHIIAPVMRRKMQENNII